MPKISRAETIENPNYLGHDEDHNGDWNEFWMCPYCKENNYLTLNAPKCLCGATLEWID